MASSLETSFLALRYDHAKVDDYDTNSTNNIERLPWLTEEFILSKALEISYSYGRHWSFETMINQSSVHKPRMDEWMDRWIDRCEGRREE